MPRRGDDHPRQGTGTLPRHPRDPGEAATPAMAMAATRGRIPIGCPIWTHATSRMGVGHEAEVAPLGPRTPASGQADNYAGPFPALPIFGRRARQRWTVTTRPSQPEVVTTRWIL